MSEHIQAKDGNLWGAEKRAHTCGCVCVCARVHEHICTCARARARVPGHIHSCVSDYMYLGKAEEEILH